jgi:hypothetical protein
MKASKNKCYYCDKKIKGKKDKEENFNRIEVKDGYAGSWSASSAKPGAPVTNYTYYRCKIACAVKWIPLRDPHIDKISEKLNNLNISVNDSFTHINIALDELNALHEAEVKRVSALELKAYLEGKKGKK